MNEIEKAEHAPSRPSLWQGYLALLLGMMVCVFLYWCAPQAAHLLTRHESVFFPLALIASALRGRLEFAIVVLVLLFVIAVFARKRRIHLGFVGVVFLVSLGFAAAAWLSAIIAPSITPLQAFDYNHDQYVLVSVYGPVFEWRHLSPIKAYTVLKCDAMGLWCSSEGTPFVIEEWSDDWASFDNSARLFIDDGKLKLRDGETVYQVHNHWMIER